MYSRYIFRYDSNNTIFLWYSHIVADIGENCSGHLLYFWIGHILCNPSISEFWFVAESISWMLISFPTKLVKLYKIWLWPNLICKLKKRREYVAFLMLNDIRKNLDGRKLWQCNDESLCQCLHFAWKRWFREQTRNIACVFIYPQTDISYAYPSLLLKSSAYAGCAFKTPPYNKPSAGA